VWAATVAQRPCSRCFCHLQLKFQLGCQLFTCLTANRPPIDRARNPFQLADGTVRGPPPAAAPQGLLKTAPCDMARPRPSPPARRAKSMVAGSSDRLPGRRSIVAKHNLVLSAPRPGLTKRFPSGSSANQCGHSSGNRRIRGIHSGIGHASSSSNSRASIRARCRRDLVAANSKPRRSAVSLMLNPSTSRISRMAR
jgi:hypothetical protein